MLPVVLRWLSALHRSSQIRGLKPASTAIDLLWKSSRLPVNTKLKSFLKSTIVIAVVMDNFAFNAPVPQILYDQPQTWLRCFFYAKQPWPARGWFPYAEIRLIDRDTMVLHGWDRQVGQFYQETRPGTRHATFWQWPDVDGDDRIRISVVTLDIEYAEHAGSRHDIRTRGHCEARDSLQARTMPMVMELQRPMFLDVEAQPAVSAHN